MKDSSDKLEEQRATLAAAEESDENPATQALPDENEVQVVELREKYLEQMNQLWAAEERIGMIDQELVELQKEKRQLDKQLDRITPENNQERASKLVQNVTFILTLNRFGCQFHGTFQNKHLS